MEKILIIGPIKPPIGGVSEHIYRFSYHFSKQYNIVQLDESNIKKPGILNIHSFLIQKILAEFRSSNVVISHTPFYLFRILYGLLAKLMRQKYIVYIHSDRRKGLLIETARTIVSLIADRVITSNQEIQARFPNSICLPAYLPPSKTPLLDTFLYNLIMKEKKRGKRIVVSNAWKIVIENDSDLYGLNFFSAISKALISDNKLFFVFNVADQLHNTDYIEGFRKNAGPNYYIGDYLDDFNHIYKISDIYIRCKSGRAHV